MEKEPSKSFLSPRATALLAELLADPDMTDPVASSSDVPYDHCEDSAVVASSLDGHSGYMPGMTSSFEAMGVAHPIAPLRHD